jgi:hypothetical protein
MSLDIKTLQTKRDPGDALGEKGIYISSKLANSLIDSAVYSTLGPINRYELHLGVRYTYWSRNSTIYLQISPKAPLTVFLGCR